MAKRLSAWRVIASASSLDRLAGQVLRLASDDVLVIGDGKPEVDDPEAIVEPDQGWVALSMPEERVLDLIATHASWQPPTDRPSVAQGMLAGLPVKAYLDGRESMLIAAAPFEHELEERLGQERVDQ